MNIDVAFVDKWITLELAAALAMEPSLGGPSGPSVKGVGMYALYFPEHGYTYFGDSGDLTYIKSFHLYNLLCQRHELPAVQQAYNDDPQGKVLFFTIPTSTREKARELLQQFLSAYAGQEQLLN